VETKSAKKKGKFAMRKEEKSIFNNHNIATQSQEQKSVKTDFINDFIHYWREFKQLVVPPTAKERVRWEMLADICQKKLTSLTKPFYERWKKTGLLNWGHYINKYASLTLNVKAGYLLIPYRFLLFESHYPQNTTLETLNQDRSENGYERAIAELGRDLNIELKKNELGIIKLIANTQLTRTLEKFPTTKELAYSLRCRDDRTITRAMDFLLWNSILSTIYLVNVSKIGYETDVVFHKTIEEISPDILAHIATSFPLNTMGDHVSVIQYPYNAIDKIKQIEKILEPVKSIRMNNQIRQWNFAGLTKKRQKRWQLRPPILEGQRLIDKVILVHSGIEYNLNTYLEPYTLQPLEARLLGIVHRMAAASEKILTEELKIGREYLAEVWKKLLKSKIIQRFPLFANIGLGGFVHFGIKGDEGIHTEILNNIGKQIQFFPYSNIYSNCDKGLLIGSVNIPPHWVRTFLYRLAELPSMVTGLKYFYYIGPEAYEPWGLDFVKTYNWEEKNTN
jgi:hypothetical protein